MLRRLSRHRHVLGAILFAGGLATAQAAEFQVDLAPVAHDRTQIGNVGGMGAATATLSGSTLTVKGSFSGLPSNATGVRIIAGPSFGIPVAGTSAGPLANQAAKPLAGAQFTISSAASGDFSGTVTLSEPELASLNKGGLYMVVTSVKAPNGNLWGWFQSGAGVQ